MNIKTSIKELIRYQKTLALANGIQLTSWEALRAGIASTIKIMTKWLFTTPAGLATVAAVTVGALITYNKKLEESRQKMIEAGKEAAQLTKDLDGLVEQYRKLGADGKLDNSDREQARNIQEQINALLGDEAKYIDLSNGGYEHQLKLLRRLQYEQANAKYATLKDAKEAAEDSLLSKSIIAEAGTWETSDEKDAIAEVMKKHGFEDYMGENGYGEKVLSAFNVDTSSAEAAIKSYEDMIKLRDILRQSYKKEIEEGGALEDFYDSLNKKIDDMSGAVQKYKDAINDYNINEAVVQFNETDFGGVKGALIETKEQMDLWIKSMVESDDISDGVKENLIGLAKTYYPDLSDAINESVQAHYKEKYAKAKSSSEIGNHIKNLDAEADQCGLTKKAYIELISTEILFNNNNLNVSQKISALQQLAYQAGITADKMRQALMFDSLQKAYDINTLGVERAYRNGLITKEERDSRKAQILSELNSSLYEGYEDGSGGGSGGGGGADGGSGSGGSEKNEALDNYLKNVENLYKIRQNETQYINDLQWALDNLVKTEGERLDIIGKQNKAYKTLADNQIKDLEHQIDLAKELYGEDYDVTGYYAQVQKTASDEANRYREFARKELGYYNEGITDEQKAEIDADVEKTDEIQGLQKTWWEAQDAIVDWKWQNSNNWIDERNTKGDWSLYGDSEYEAWKRVAKWLREEYPNEIEKIKEADQKAIDARYQHSLDWIEERNTYNDWALFEDSEVDAWERVIKWLNEEYPDEIKKIKEAEKSLFEARKEQFDKATNFGNTYLDSTKTLLQSYYDVTNSVAEAQHEINKELETSKTMYEYLDEETRKLLFNQDDYNELSEELLDIQYKADKLQRQYKRDLDNATLETIEKITSNYQMQYETLMKSYEIAKADLEIAKKKQKLNNVLNERNVRMFINGSWQWVANTEDVANAKSELADAEYAKRVEEAGLAQQNSINELTKKQDALGVVIKEFENGVIDLDTAVYKAEIAIGRMPDAIESMFGKALSSSKSSSSDSGGGSSASSSSVNRVVGYDKNTDYMAKILASDNQMDVIEYNAARNAKILGEDMESDEIKVMTESEALDIWKKAKGHAGGTRYTPGGLTKMGEDGDEFYIPANGRLIPISQPTIGNIPSGGVVFNSEQMKNLRTMWDMSNLRFAGSSNFAGSAKPQQIDQSQDNRIIINGMTVDSGSADGQALISALRRYVGNH